jgi:hypothetical protein
MPDPFKREPWLSSVGLMSETNSLRKNVPLSRAILSFDYLEVAPPQNIPRRLE